MKKEDLEELLKIVCCPYCSGKLEIKSENEAVCKECRRVYKVKNDILVLL